MATRRWCWCAGMCGVLQVGASLGQWCNLAWGSTPSAAVGCGGYKTVLQPGELACVLACVHQAPGKARSMHAVGCRMLAHGVCVCVCVFIRVRVCIHMSCVCAPVCVCLCVLCVHLCARVRVCCVCVCHVCGQVEQRHKDWARIESELTRRLQVCMCACV